ncbi:Holliday junction resolvase RuvX [Balneolales bacterium ANBcel1]|nr:Holliday junction resolvase RuvX [Balneolales bacterium ANBcel1]
MTHLQRTLGVDVGLKRIGIAQSDVTGTLASPLGTFASGEALTLISGMCDRGDVRSIVVGWPLTLRGEEGESVRMVKSFIARLEKQTGDVPIITLDERFTSTIAHQSIRDSGAGRKKRRDKGRVDSTAAAILLQNYLDAQ